MYGNHGGGCCGMKHLFGLDRMSLEEFDRVVREHFEEPRGIRGLNNNRILEVVLSERQIETDPLDARFDRSIINAGGWPAVLASRGFKLAETWRNSNSGNMCYRFVKLEGEGFAPPPEWWANDRLTLHEAPAVIRVTTRPELIVGSTVEHRTFGRGLVVELNGETVRVRFARGFRDVDVTALTKVVFEEQIPLPLTTDLPLEVYFPEGPPVPVARAAIGGNRDRIDTELGWFHIDTGEYGIRTTLNFRGRRGGKLRNTPRIVDRNPEERDPAPREVLVELFALFQNGNIRGPFNNQEEIRAAYPRVRSFRTRRILSDGAITTEDQRF